MSARNKENPAPFYVVGIGASAGGLEAINLLLSNAPVNSGFAFVIVQHLSPDYKSLMPELLARHTKMQVIEATDGIALMPDCVYLLPSKKTMTVKSGKLVLHDKEKAAIVNHTIDLLFASMADEYGKDAIGIVLSGTGTDGTQGVTAISEKGGIVMVQEPATSGFSGMPDSAIAAGVANLILPPQHMIGELIDYINDPHSMRSLRLNTHSDEVVLSEIIQLIRKVTGQDFNHYKHPTLIRRLSKRMAELNISNTQEYLSLLQDNAAEIKILAQNFLINVTNFFRDKEAFDILRDEVIPAIFKGKQPRDTIKVWVVACCSGEEAYSLAILFHEYMERYGLRDMTVKIFATDIDRDALEIASKGVYPRSIIDVVSGQRIAKCFEPDGDNYRVKQDIRKMVVFSHHDVLRDPPFGRLDLVSCRNMLIYINAEAQKSILRKLHFALNLNGYLFVGPSEHVDVLRSSLEEIDKKWRIYKCISKARLYEQQPYFQPFDKNALVRTVTEVKAKNPLQHLGELFKETLLEDQAYAGIFIDLNFDVRQAIGNYKSYLGFPQEQFNFNLLKLVHPDLAVVVSAIVRRAIQDNRPMSQKGVKLHQADKVRTVDVIVKPYLHHSSFAQQFVFIVLKEDVRVESPSENPVRSITEHETKRIEELERELRDTRENLQALIEEMEAANEELQSANEEMVSTNEELQSSNEELQSLNEELHTLSVEHQLKIKELMELNDDLNNYFRNSDIGQVLVDKNFIVKKFSPSVTRMVNLIPSDVHRSIVDITTRFKGVDFIGDIRQVIRSGMTVEREVAVDDSIYILRIVPYERYDRKIDGVVINFIDVTRIRQLDSILEAIFRTVPSAIIAAKANRNERHDISDFEIMAINHAAELSIGRNRHDIVGKKLKSVFPAGYKEMIRTYREVVETDRPRSYDFFNEHLNNWSNVVVVKFLDGVIAVSTDITEKKKAADLVEQNYEELRKTLKLNKKKS